MASDCVGALPEKSREWGSVGEGLGSRGPACGGLCCVKLPTQPRAYLETVFSSF